MQVQVRSQCSGSSECTSSGTRHAESAAESTQMEVDLSTCQGRQIKIRHLEWHLTFIRASSCTIDGRGIAGQSTWLSSVTLDRRSLEIQKLEQHDRLLLPSLVVGSPKRCALLLARYQSIDNMTVRSLTPARQPRCRVRNTEERNQSRRI
jgi:hypothetical protein